MIWANRSQLFEIKEKLGWSDTELCEAIGLSKWKYMDMMDGEYNLDMLEMAQIRAFLGKYRRNPKHLRKLVSEPKGTKQERTA